jgi:hypothetical protein
VTALGLRRSRGLVLGGIWLRVLTWLSAGDLDRRLADGSDPMLSDELSLRVGQLGLARVRLANVLRTAVEMANGRRSPLIATRLRRDAIRECDELLLTLAERLRCGEPVGAQGLAMTARLVADRAGPLYRSRASRSLSSAVADALAALGHGHMTIAGRRP